MGSEGTNLEERLRSLLLQLQAESGILDRIVYKGKNQHRRCPYFQALLKVRRDVRLLNSAGLGEILNALFPIIDGRRPAQKAYHSKRVKNSHSAKHNYLERLLGVARLLSQMAEPILKAAIQISFLLAKSFFTGFSLTILALLARLRVLVQQILLDVVSVFNKVSSLSQKKHSVKVMQQGIEAFREYHPLSRDVLTLECVWEEDKFVLLERRDHSNTDIQEEDQGALPLELSIQYEAIQLFSEVQCPDNERSSEKILMDIPANGKCHADQSATVSDSITVMDCKEIPSISPPEGNTIDSGESIPSSKSMRPQTGSSKKVAFIPVSMPKLSETDTSGLSKKMKLDQLSSDLKSEDSLLNLIEGGKDSTIF